MSKQKVMKTARADVERNRQEIICIYSNSFGHSKKSARYRDFVLFRDPATQQNIIGRYHGKIRANDNSTCGRWMMLVQAADFFGNCSFERWVEPAWVIETCPANAAAPEVVAFFERTINYFAV
jgi:hypothetical protein